jgi:hypothetical protein
MGKRHCQAAAHGSCFAPERLTAGVGPEELEMRNTCLGLATMLALLSGCQQPTATADKPGTEEAQKSAPVVGSIAPMFTTQGALAGKPFTLDLAEQLKKGPLVLYFFPKVFTSGCTAEAHEFAERSGDFAKLGANVVGLSADSIEELSMGERDRASARSRSACRENGRRGKGRAAACAGQARCARAGSKDWSMPAVSAKSARLRARQL